MNKRVFQTVYCITFLTLVYGERNFVNIALWKKTKQSSTFRNMDIYDASKAVDNDSNTFSHTGQEMNEWWEVDLGEVYPVLFIRIYPHHNNFGRIASTLISVDEEECARISEIVNNPTNVKCSRILNGRRINIKKLDYASDKFLQIVEFAVLACLEGFHGEECNLKCGHCYEGTACDRVTGHCPRCKAGFAMPMCTNSCVGGMYGENCSIACGQCAEGETCHPVNGSCENCVEGKKPPLCTTECEDGYYGQNCARKCGQCQGGEPCNKTTGHCSSCSRGKQPPLCQQNCRKGTFGSDCLEKCGSCENMTFCDIVSGHCPTCQAGFQPPICAKNATTSDGLIVGSILGGFVIIAATILFAVLVKRSRNRQDTTTLPSAVRLSELQEKTEEISTHSPCAVQQLVDYEEIENTNTYDSLDPNSQNEISEYTPTVFEEIGNFSQKDECVYVND